MQQSILSMINDGIYFLLSIILLHKNKVSKVDAEIRDRIVNFYIFSLAFTFMNYYDSYTYSDLTTVLH